MTSRASAVGGLLALLLVASIGRAQDVPDPFVFTPGLVQLDQKYPAPDWVKPGTRITYYMGSASNVSDLIEDPNGNIQLDDGKWYREGMPGGAAGAMSGFCVIDVGHVDADTVSCVNRGYGKGDFEHPERMLPAYADDGFVTNAYAASRAWVHPDILAKIPNQNANGMRVIRHGYRFGDRIIPAIRITYTSGRSTQQSTLATDSGILLTYGFSSPHNERIVRGQRNFGRAFEVYVLADCRQLDLPPGHATFGGLFLPPAAIPGLRQGQVLDEDRFIQTRWVVSAVGNGSVTLTEVGPNHQHDYTYDDKGLLVAVGTRLQLGQGTQIRRLRLESIR